VHSAHQPADLHEGLRVASRSASSQDLEDDDGGVVSSADPQSGGERGHDDAIIYLEEQLEAMTTAFTLGISTPIYHHSATR